MTIKELIEQLLTLDQNRIVVMSRDQEGNGFKELCDIETAAYDSKSEEIGLESLTDKDRARGYSEEDVMEDGVPAVIFWP